MLIQQFSNESNQNMKENKKIDFMFNERVPGGNILKKALGNHVIMKKVVNCLNDVGDFIRMYDSCEIFRNIFDVMDESIWRGLANTLLMALGIEDKNFLNEQFHDKSFRDIFLILRRCAEHQANMIKRKIYINSSFNGTDPSLEDITEASILARHGLLGPMEEFFILILKDVDLSSIPSRNLGSFLACVTWRIEIWNTANIDLIPILNMIKCQHLSFYDQPLRTKETQALVQAMKTRVERVTLFTCYENIDIDIETLTTYAGSGICDSLHLTGNFFSITNMRSWAKSVGWRLKIVGDDIHNVSLYNKNRDF